MLIAEFLKVRKTEDRRTPGSIAILFQWISDPANNPNGDKYEDLQGAWHAVGATVAGIDAPASNAVRRLAASLDGNRNSRVAAS